MEPKRGGRGRADNCRDMGHEGTRRAYLWGSQREPLLASHTLSSNVRSHTTPGPHAPSGGPTAVDPGCDFSSSFGRLHRTQPNFRLSAMTDLLGIYPITGHREVQN
jgi:hypothetical protein